jgi:hypothetical protein
VLDAVDEHAAQSAELRGREPIPSASSMRPPIRAISARSSSSKTSTVRASSAGPDRRRSARGERRAAALGDLRVEALGLDGLGILDDLGVLLAHASYVTAGRRRR